MSPFGRIILIFLIGCLRTQAETSPSEPLKYAGNFEVDKYPTHTLLTVGNYFPSATQKYRYALVPKGARLPDLPEDVSVIRTPVRKVVIMETIYIGYLDALQQLDSVVGAGTAHFIHHPKLRKRISGGTIQAISTGRSLDIESLLLLQPDLILTGISTDPDFDLPAKLLRSGLPIVITAGYMEHHPLARSEWIRFIASFFELDELAEDIFNRTAKRYASLKKRVSDVDSRPSVFCGAPYSGTWYIPGGNSFTARAIKDAGGHYLWSDNSQRGSVPLNTERVFQKAAQADFWIHPSHYRTLKELLQADHRFGKFRPVQTGLVYNNTKQIGPGGGNNIWERGVMHPEEVLADLIHLFHPKRLPGHQLIYYKQL